MKQEAEVINLNNGNTRIKFKQSQKEIALSRDEVVFLTQIPDRYLLDEVVSRGIGAAKLTQNLLSEGNPLDRFFDEVLDFYCILGEQNLDDLVPYIVARAVERFGSQRKAAEALGISHYKISYLMTSRYKLTKVAPPDREGFMARLGGAVEQKEEPIDVKPHIDNGGEQTETEEEPAEAAEVDCGDWDW